MRTSRLLQSVLLAEGFDLSPASEALPTSFRAVYGPSANGPRVTFTAEMDALPGLGHACGHNIIGTAGTYAAIVLKSVLGRDIPGTIEVVGTPAEERGSGKVRMIQDEVFARSDVVLQIHPHSIDTVVGQALARRTLVVEFFGKKAHAAAAPLEGRNALDALVLFYHSAALPRTKFPAGTLFHGIIESGGEAPNIIPDYARGRFSLRSDTMTKLESLVAEVRCLAEKAAAETGCRAKISEPGPGVTTFRRNRVLEEIFAPLFEERGRSDPAKLRDILRLDRPGQCLLGRPDDRADDQGQRLPHPHRGLRPGCRSGRRRAGPSRRRLLPGRGGGPHPDRARPPRARSERISGPRPRTRRKGSPEAAARMRSLSDFGRKSGAVTVVITDSGLGGLLVCADLDRRLRATAGDGSRPPRLCQRLARRPPWL